MVENPDFFNEHTLVSRPAGERNPADKCSVASPASGVKERWSGSRLGGYRLFPAEGKDVYYLQYAQGIEDEENDVLIGHARLRFPSSTAHRSEIEKDKTSIVRELHIYGPIAPLAVRMTDAWQHRGYGRTLLKTAEKISLDSDRPRVLITSALGAREYFRKLGYSPKGPYMEKVLN